MKTPHIPNSLLPKPRKVTLREGLFSFAGDLRIHAAAEFQQEKTRLIDTLSRFGIAAHAEGTQEAAITILHQNALPPEAFAIEVAPESIRLEAADRAGAQYGCIAIGQLASLATQTGSVNPVCECCKIEDAPEFCWRGLMLDSARHFQSVETVRQVIKMMGVWRLRILHLHLTDSQGWRFCTPETMKLGLHDEEFYSEENLREIAALAEEYNIEIVPEIDMPSHQLHLVQSNPGFSCDPDHLTAELCITSEKVKRFLKDILREVVRQLPGCRYIHLGGDEAETVNWENCPSCRKVMKEKKLTIHRLEQLFMNEMCDFVRSLGRTPIAWCSDADVPEGAIMQTWRISWKDINKARAAKALMINSISQNFYFDFPQNCAEPSAPAMPILNEESVYHSSPYFFLHKENAAKEFIGIEACLWTETVPDWRVICKIEERLPALSECCWTPAAERSFEEFRFRRMQLESAGWLRLANAGIL